MNIKKFKSLIKDAVVEALYEEMPDLINEAINKQNRKQHINESNIVFNSSDVSTVPLPIEERKRLAEKMGAKFGFTSPVQQYEKLEVKNEVDETGKRKNPFEDFINDTAINLTPQDIAGLNNL